MTEGLREFTVRGFVLGAVLTLIFSASNAYLGLKVGMTFATSIPAAVMSMALLRSLGNNGILENNIVQTIASAGAAVVSVIFTLPALVMVGFWQGFPFWLVFVITAATGILGVVFTVPLRRAMVVESPLKYPEGVAAAEVLRAGQAEVDGPKGGAAQPGGALGGLRDISFGAAIAAVVALVTDGFRLAADAGNLWWRIGEARFGIGMEYSLALVGAGYLIGLRAAFGLLVGVILAWFVAVPILSGTMTWPADMSAEAVASKVWSDDVRFIGVGAIGFGAIWTLLVLLRPLWEGMKASVRAYAHMRAGGGASVPREERDMPPPLMAVLVLAMLVPIVGLMLAFMADGPAEVAGGTYWALVVFATLYVLVAGFLTASAAGYMAGLLGSSSSPISGIAVLALLGGAVVLSLWFGPQDGSDDLLQVFLVAAAVFMATGVLGVASIANDNLQDLKTGQLVGATPWKQQASLIFGVAVGALVVPPILQLLYEAYGMGGSLPRSGMDPKDVLQAPQAMMIQTLGRGIVAETLNWTYIGIGVAGGIVLVVWNGIADRFGWQLQASPLAVGIAMYLPSMISVTILAGALLNHLIERGRRHASATDAEEAAGGTGTLVSAGMIVGASLFGVLMAVLIVVSGSGDPLQLADLADGPAGPWIGLVVFLAAVAAGGAYIRRHLH